jgi:septum formation topological specificity factor MinE
MSKPASTVSTPPGKVPALRKEALKLVKDITELSREGFAVSMEEAKDEADQAAKR